MTCARVVACLAVLALFGGAILTQEPATGKGDKKPTKPAAAPADKKPTTHKVTEQPFKIERTIANETRKKKYQRRAKRNDHQAHGDSILIVAVAWRSIPFSNPPTSGVFATGR